FTVGLPEEHYALRLKHYFYDESMKLKFFQRVSQRYYSNREYELADISNEMQYNWSEWSVYNNMTYAYEYGKIRESSSYVSLNQLDYYLSVGHSYREVLPDEIDRFYGIDTTANDISFSFGYTVNKKIAFNGGFTYDLDDVSDTQWRIGGSYHRDCWNLVASIRQDITPRPTGFTTDNSFNLQLNFVPFGSIGTGDTPQFRTIGTGDTTQ
ncbi:MAG TPA: hypothetical protein VLL31_03795, partial [Sulfurovum sp.]|nr:hypothetical protein [Sulfurovum sp.]